MIPICFKYFELSKSIKIMLSKITNSNYSASFFVLYLYTPLKIIGKIKSVNIVDVTSPPITTIASGREVSEPIPVDVAAGKSPMAAMRAVITTGLIRAITPKRMASSRCIRSCRFFLNRDSRITLFWIHIPNKAIKPIPADILKFVAVTWSAVMPPIIAKGTFRRIRPASATLPKSTKRMKKISGSG